MQHVGARSRSLLKATKSASRTAKTCKLPADAAVKMLLSIACSMWQVAPAPLPYPPLPSLSFPSLFWGCWRHNWVRCGAVTMSRSPDRRHYKQPETHTHTHRQTTRGKFLWRCKFEWTCRLPQFVAVIARCHRPFCRASGSVVLLPTTN